MGPRFTGTRILWATLATSLLALHLFAAPGSCGQRSDFVYFQGTQYPLAVTFLGGTADGPTVLVQGGIQGDEPSGFVTAALLTHATVTRGNLIIVPRANVPSINLCRRAVNVDMNRRFDKDHNAYYEDRVARVIRFLLSRSQALIHLHEGSGFYSPKFVNAERNPSRYGQSIIIDAMNHGGLDLEGLVRPVLDDLNAHISPRNWSFTLFNTRTFDRDTTHAEQRQSLTYYALSVLNIPAMAVEVSKSIRDLEWKVRHQMEATLLLLRRLGVSATMPPLDGRIIQEHAAAPGTVLVNGSPMRAGDEISLRPGETLSVERPGSGAEGPSLALFASDRPEVNLLAAPRMALASFADLELRADGQRVARARVNWNGSQPASPPDGRVVFVCWHNNRPVFVRSGESLRAVAGDQLILEGVWGSAKREVLNLKGFVSGNNNSGQDLGCEIILDPGNFLPAYHMPSPTPGAVRFQVERQTPGSRGDGFFVDIEPHAVRALRLADAAGREFVVPWADGSEFFLPEGKYRYQGVDANGEADKLLALNGLEPVNSGALLIVGDRPLRLSLWQSTTFGGVGSVTLRTGRLAQNRAALGGMPN